MESHFKSVLSFGSLDGKVSEAEEFFAEDGAGSLYKSGFNNNKIFIEQTDAKDMVLIDKTYHTYVISHLPGAFVYDVCKLIRLPFDIRLIMIRFCYLILYSVICYFAIKKLKTNKLIFAAIALFPTCIFIATNITYD